MVLTRFSGHFTVTLGLPPVQWSLPVLKAPTVATEGQSSTPITPRKGLMFHAESHRERTQKLYDPKNQDSLTHAVATRSVGAWKFSITFPSGLSIRIDEPECIALRIRVMNPSSSEITADLTNRRNAACLEILDGGL